MRIPLCAYGRVGWLVSRDIARELVVQSRPGGSWVALSMLRLTPNSGEALALCTPSHCLSSAGEGL